MPMPQPPPTPALLTHVFWHTRPPPIPAPLICIFQHAWLHTHLLHSNANTSSTTHTSLPNLHFRTRMTVSPPSSPFPFQRQSLNHHPHSIFEHARPYPHPPPPFHYNANASATTHASSRNLRIWTCATISPSLPFSNSSPLPMPHICSWLFPQHSVLPQSLQFVFRPLHFPFKFFCNLKIK